MCGIAGVFNYRHDSRLVNGKELLRMREAVIASGPDGAGLWISGD
jgi:asparagine synthase (glutamine-hydrolysing)